jgi:crotonobetainyl-CoA:carnitine CoA-transferase CaiB-like acyl-CoA transferase
MNMAGRSEKRGYSLLDGIRILDFAEGAFSFAGKILADLGADVIKIERPGGEPGRRIGPFIQDHPHPEKSLSFFSHNSNKRGVTLDIEMPAGQQLLLRLLGQVDGVIESFAPGKLESLGLGFQRICQMKSGLILVSITGFGQTGPHKDFAFCDLVISAYGGQMFVSGSPLTPPVKAAGEQTLYFASLYAVVAFLLALMKRNETGSGSQIDISAQEAAVSSLENVLVKYLFEEMIAARQGNVYANHAFGVFPCRDGFILLSILQNWETLLELIAGDGMAEDLQEEKWNDPDFRRNNMAHIFEVVERWTQTRSKGKLFELGQLMRFPWAPIQNPEEVLRDPQLESRSFFLSKLHPQTNTSFQIPSIPFRSNLPLHRKWLPAPEIGEHNQEIYQEALGLSSDEIKQLAGLGVI